MPKPIRIAYIASAFPSKLIGYNHWATAMMYLEHCPSVYIYHDRETYYYKHFEPNKDCIAEFQQEYPQYAERVLPITPGILPQADGYIVDFLMGGNWLVANLKEGEAKFIVNLHNGGGLVLHNEDSDLALKRVLGSKSFFSGVVGFGLDYYKYLIAHNFPNWYKLVPVKHGLIPLNLLTIDNRDYFQDGVVNITFVAANYGGKVDKGIDQFLNSVRLLKELDNSAKFRLVGNWKLEEIGASDLIDDIEVYPYVDFETLTRIYLMTDIFLAPLARHSHESFPNGATVAAMLHGCLVLASDPRNSSNATNYIPDVDFILIGSEIADIVIKINEIVDDKERFMEVIKTGRDAARRNNEQVHRILISVNLVRQLEADILANRS